ncbi:MAG: prephenate dehydrogenase/arogenate dehydrogenase family protein [bacterium]
MKRVAIIGLGLMGGSLGLALKKSAGTIVAAFARRSETRRAALETGAVDEVFDTPQAALRGANVAVFCTPVLSIPALVESCLPAFEKGCVVTDVGSTKAEIVSRMAALGEGGGIRFVGSHPMAGAEKTGIEAARVDLYEGAVTVITPSPETALADVDIITELWRGVGARVIRLAPSMHDRLVARTSHLPHLIAALLVDTVSRDVTSPLKALIGAGFRDTTRIAGGSSEMWHDIIKTNKPAIIEELQAYDKALRDLIRLIESDQFEVVRALLEKQRVQRATLMG